MSEIGGRVKPGSVLGRSLLGKSVRDNARIRPSHGLPIIT